MKKTGNFVKVLKKYSFVFTAIAFLVNKAYSYYAESINAMQISLRTVFFCMVLVLEVVVVCIQYRIQKEQEERGEENKRNERAKLVLSQMNVLQEHKTNCLKEASYEGRIFEQDKILFYEVHNYMKQICLNLSETVADLIELERKHVDVALIYRHVGNPNWKWIAGKSSTSDSQELNEFVDVRETTLFYYLTHNQNVSPVFANDKGKLIEAGHYEPGNRDRLFKNEGSVMGMNLTYFNNQRRLIDAVLVISTYGERFVPKEMENEETIAKFEQTLIYEVLPYYTSMLQTEMGELYIRHVVKASNEKEDPIL